MKKYFKYLLTIAISLILLPGCRQELVYEDVADNPYRLNMELEWVLDWEVNADYNWSDNWDDLGADNDYDYFRPRKPEGVAVILYNELNGNYVFSKELHLSSAGGSFSIEPTTRAILFFNDDSDYVVVNNLGSPHTVTASTGNHTNTSFTDLHKGERSVKQPDILYGSFMEITEEQILKGEIPDKVVISPLVYGYVIKYHIEKNLEYVKEATGALAGMAENVNIMTGTTSDSKATFVFECDKTSYGIGVQVMTFGIPSMQGFNSKASSDYSGQHDLRMIVKLTNGKTVTLDHDITDQIANQPKGGVITIPDINISDDMVGGNSGFQPDVDDWGENTDIPLN